MMLSICMCVMAGFLLGRRFKALVLLPASLLGVLAAFATTWADAGSVLVLLARVATFPVAIQAGYGLALFAGVRGAPMPLRHVARH